MTAAELRRQFELTNYRVMIRYPYITLDHTALSIAQTEKENLIKRGRLTLTHGIPDAVWLQTRISATLLSDVLKLASGNASISVAKI